MSSQEQASHSRKEPEVPRFQKEADVGEEGSLPLGVISGDTFWFWDAPQKRAKIRANTDSHWEQLTILSSCDSNHVLSLRDLVSRALAFL